MSGFQFYKQRSEIRNVELTEQFVKVKHGKYIAIHRKFRKNGEWETVETRYTHKIPEDFDLKITYFALSDSVHYGDAVIIYAGKLVDIRKLLAESQGIYYSYNENLPGFPCAKFTEEHGYMKCTGKCEKDKLYLLCSGKYYVSDDVAPKILGGNYSETPISAEICSTEPAMIRFSHGSGGSSMEYTYAAAMSVIKCKFGSECENITYTPLGDIPGFFVSRTYMAPLFLSTRYLSEMLIDKK